RTLEEAQRNKADHVARKVMLRPGDEVVDVGSGFGGFLLHAQEHYGVRITAINTTGSQAEHVRRQIESRKIGDSIQMHADFRAWGERFDRNWERIRALDPRQFGERFRRIWRVYLYGCAEMFRSPSGRTHLFQIVFSKGNAGRSGYPMTRDFLYRDHAGDGQLPK